MQIGKIPEPVLKRSVLKQIVTKRPEVLVGAQIAGDFSAFRLEESEVVIMTTNSVDTENKISFAIALQKVINNLTVSGATPIGLMLNILLPYQGEETVLKALLRQAEAFCKERKMQIIGGHSELFKAVHCAVVTITGIGKVKEENLICSSGGIANQEIVITKSIGIEGTAILAREWEEEYKKRYSKEFLQKAKDYIQDLSIEKEVEIVKQYDISMLHDVSTGGIFAALWEAAVSSKVGLEVDLNKIPIRQETVEICELFHLNPYQIASAGSLLLFTNQGNDIVKALEKEGIRATIIGKTTSGNDKIVYNEEERRFLEPPKLDEKDKMREKKKLERSIK